MMAVKVFLFLIGIFLFIPALFQIFPCPQDYKYDGQWFQVICFTLLSFLCFYWNYRL